MSIDKTKLYFIIETAFHHEGNVDFLKELLDSYKNIRADAVKMHLLFDIEDYMIASHQAIDVMRSISIPKSSWPEILTIVEEQGKDIILLCNDLESLKWVNNIQKDYPIVALELHSTGLNDIFLLNEAANFNGTIILGVGGSTFNEIKYAVDFLSRRGKTDIVLMHGFQNYPTNAADINFKRIALMRDAFGCEVGYADHTDPNDKNNVLFSILPISMGVKIIEKHVTNVFGVKRIDSQAAVTADTMQAIIDVGHECYNTLGNGSFEFSEGEKQYGNTGPMKKAIVARKKIEKGEKISLSNIAFKRTESSSHIVQMDLEKIIGSTVIKDVVKDELIGYDNIKYQFQKTNFDQFFISNNE